MRIKSLAIVAAAAAVLKVVSLDARAGDVTWDNGSSDFLWNTTSLNWTGAAWNAAGTDGAIFGATGAGMISVPGAIRVNSMLFSANGYSLGGTGSIEIVDGVSSQTTAVVNVGTAVLAQVNVPVFSAVGFQKIGAGSLVLNGVGNSFGGGVVLDPRGTLTTDLLVGGTFGQINGGHLKIGSDNVIPDTTRVSIGTGYFDIGGNKVTLGQLIFTSQNPARPWDTTFNANNGVIGSGTLKVLGEINVQGQFGDNSSNAIAANVDLGGGTQIVRIGAGSQFITNSALIFSGNLSNGSLLKSLGYNPNGVQTTTDGISLFGNNTYTGSTVLNGGQNVIAGTNATSSIKIAGMFGGAATSLVTLFGANGSAQNASTIQAFAGGSFVLDNNASAGDASLIFGPNTPAAQNNDRIRDDAVVELRDGAFTYRGRSAVAATETYGRLNVLGGHNVLTITPNGAGGTASLTANGNLSMAPRATLLVSGTTLGAAGKVFFNGTTPTPDATGILPRIVGTSDFLTYNATTGLTPYTGYATNFTTPGANVAATAAATVASSIDINALKRTGSFTLTIGSGQTLGITSGMILNTSGTGTITGGAIAFGSNPGMLVGTNIVSSAVTGSAGLIMASGTGTLSGDLSGLGGALDIYAATANINTNTFTGPINNRNGTLNLNVSQTGTGLGAITIGVAQNDENLFGTNPVTSVSGAGANAVFDRDIISDNGAKTAAGVTFRYSLLPGISVLSNSTGSQTFNGNITLNTGLRIQGGGASATSTGATVFNGNISGEGTIAVPNGRVIFNGTYSNAGGFLLGDQGFTVKAIFTGTGSGNGSVIISGGNSNTVSYENGAFPGGPIVVRNSSPASAPQLIPLDDSTINNQIILGPSLQNGEQGDVIVNVGTGIKATWAGVVSGPNSLNKTGAGALILSNASNTHTGPVVVNAGTLRVDGALPSANVDVNSSGVLGGTGSLSGNVRINAGGTIAPGNSVGTLVVGPTLLAGSFNPEVDLSNGGAADLLAVIGSLTLDNAMLNLSLYNLPSAEAFAGGTYLLIANDGSSDPVGGTFASVTGIPAGFTAAVDYGFLGTDSLGRLGNGNDVALTIQAVPEPGGIAAMVAMALSVAGGRRRRNR